MPDRGKRNEPAFVTRTAEALAEALKVETAELAIATTKNFERLFGLKPSMGN
jgi:TatD DNase family protein